MSNNLSSSDILKLAKLSKLVLSDEEVIEMQKELSQILDFVSKLSEADVKDIKPTDQVTNLTTVLRSDKNIDYGYGLEDLMKNVPNRDNDFIKVPRMLQES